MCADFWMVILQQPGVMCYTLFNKGIHRACFVCLTSTHLHNVPNTALIWKSEKYQHVIFASVFAQVPAERRRAPRAFTWSTHTCRDTALSGISRGGGRDESKGEETMRNPEARGSNLMQRAHYSKMFVLRWHFSNNVVLHCVYICIVAMIL